MLQKNYDQVIFELRDSLGWMDLVLSNISEGILVIRNDMKILFANDAIAEIVNKPRISLLGTPVWNVLELTENGSPFKKKDYQENQIQDIYESLAGRYELNGKIPMTVDINVSAIPNMDQAILIIRDVTRQVKNEREILKERLARNEERIKRKKTEENQRLLQKIINGTSAIIYLKDSEDRYVMINTQFREAFGLGGMSVKGKKDDEVFPEEIANILHKNDRRVLESRETLRWEETIQHGNGLKTYLYLKFPIMEPSGETENICGVLTDITARKELETRKEDFIRMASHELNTPLTSIRIMLEFTRRHIEDGETEKALQDFKKFEKQLEKLTDLITDLLDVTKMETGKLELKKEDFDLNTLIREVIEVVQTTSDQHTINLYKDADQLNIFADRQRIEQVLINLLTNAIKYSPDGGHINVRVKENADNIAVSVQDFGIGISQEHQKNIFDRFYKDTSRNREFPGLGMGLYIASEIVERHGGKLEVRSKKGKGTTFTFYLPAR